MRARSLQLILWAPGLELIFDLFLETLDGLQDFEYDWAVATQLLFVEALLQLSLFQFDGCLDLRDDLFFLWLNLFSKVVDGLLQDIRTFVIIFAWSHDKLIEGCSEALLFHFYLQLRLDILTRDFQLLHELIIEIPALMLKFVLKLGVEVLELFVDRVGELLWGLVEIFLAFLFLAFKSLEGKF